MDGSVDFWGTTASQIQDGITVTGDKITGTLKYLTSGSLVETWGEGYFIGLAFDDFSSGLTYEDVQVGLTWSAGSGLVTLDSDKMGVFHITDKDTQKLTIVQTGASGKKTQYFDLSGLTLAEQEV